MTSTAMYEQELSYHLEPKAPVRRYPKHHRIIRGKMPRACLDQIIIDRAVEVYAEYQRAEEKTQW